MLVVDDDPLVSRAVARTVSRCTGVAVRCARTLEEAEAALLRGPPPAAVLMDYDLGPSSPDGVDVLSALREGGLCAPAAFFSSTPASVVRERIRGARLEPLPCFMKSGSTTLLHRWLRSRLGLGRRPP